MIKLIVNDTHKEERSNEISFGGLPVKEVNSTLEWPRCKTCQSEMQYQGKVKTEIGLELIFMCQNDPGMCEEWHADEGGNKVLVLAAEELEIFNPTHPEIALRKTAYSGKVIEMDVENYEEALDKWEGNARDILGSLYGEPDWIQGEETPSCDCCNEKMRFVAQLEEGTDHNTAMNFGGGGIAYLFDCSKGKTAKFLWQC